MSATRTVVLITLLTVASVLRAQSGIAAPGTPPIPPIPTAFDSTYVIPVHAATDAAGAYARSAAALVARGFAITQGIPDLALTGVAAENAGITLHISVAADGTAYLSAQVPASNPGLGAQSMSAAQRGSRAGAAAWKRLEELAAVIGQP